ncbi:MAG TPA: hypothetical protein VGM38_09535 [Pseudolysinimonas sp.]|jgi:hypothetical protein
MNTIFGPEEDEKVVRWAAGNPELRAKMVEVALMACWKTEEEAKQAAIIWSRGLYVAQFI